MKGKTVVVVIDSFKAWQWGEFGLGLAVLDPMVFGADLNFHPRGHGFGQRGEDEGIVGGLDVTFRPFFHKSFSDRSHHRLRSENFRAVGAISG